MTNKTPTTTETTFETIDPDQLSRASGGMNADARWVMMHESGGNTHAKNPHSSAFGAFQMILANRRHYMGRDYASTDLGKQYSAATRYVHDRYGNWHNARSFWQRNHHY